MTRTHLVQLLQQLDAYDLQHLRKFLLSPFFNHRRDVIQLFEFVARALQETPSELTKDKTWNHLYPGQPMNSQQLRLITSYLHRLVEQFLAQRILQEEDTENKLGRVKAYNRLKLEKPYQRAFQKAQNALEKQPLRDGAYLKKNFELELEYYAFTSNRKRSREANRTLQNSIDAFDRYFIALKLKYGCLALSNQMIFKDDYEIKFMTEVIDHVEKHPNLLAIPAIGLYYHCYLTITSHEAESHFENLRQSIDEHAARFDPSEIRNIYLMLLNYCTRQMNKGIEKYSRKAFELYRAGVEKKYLFENGELSGSTFSNIVFIGITLREFPWVENFILSFRKFLPPNDQDNLYFLTFASLKYHQKAYDEARDLLNNFSSKDPLFILKVRTLQTRIYFELGEFELLESHLASMSTFLRRKEVSAQLQGPYQEFIRLTRKLIRLPAHAAEKRRQLREEVQRMRVRSLRSWLLARLG